MLWKSLRRPLSYLKRVLTFDGYSHLLELKFSDGRFSSNFVKFWEYLDIVEVEPVLSSENWGWQTGIMFKKVVSIFCPKHDQTFHLGIAETVFAKVEVWRLYLCFHLKIVVFILPGLSYLNCFQICWTALFFAMRRRRLWWKKEPVSLFEKCNYWICIDSRISLRRCSHIWNLYGVPIWLQ